MLKSWQTMQQPLLPIGGEMLSHSQRDCYLQMLSALSQPGAVVRITAPSGYGKSRLLKHFLQRGHRRMQVVAIEDPALNRKQFLQLICQRLSLLQEGELLSANLMLQRLMKLMAEQGRTGVTLILVIDQAERMDPAVLELLLRLQQIVRVVPQCMRLLLLGRPEFVRDARYQALHQLISHVLPLEGLSRAESAALLLRRLGQTSLRPGLLLSPCLRWYQWKYGAVPGLLLQADLGLLKATLSAEGGQRFNPLTLPRWALATSVASLMAIALVATTSMESDLRPPLTPSAVSPQWAQQPISEPNTEKVPPLEESKAETVARESHDQAFERHMVEAAPNRDDSFNRLLGLWGLQHAGSVGKSPCGFAQESQLHCLTGFGDFDYLDRIGRPALLVLWAGFEGLDAHFVLYHGRRNGVPLLDYGEGPLEVAQQTVERYWQGDFILIWQPTGPLATVGPGSMGEPVAWVRSRLSEWDGEGDNGEQRFDTRLSQRLRRFQQAHQLQADGVAGKQTLLLLNELSPDIWGPRLYQDLPPRISMRL